MGVLQITAAIFITILCHSVAKANGIKALLASQQGTVQILTLGNGQKENQLLYEGKNYNWSKAKIGQKLNPGQIVMTGTDGKAKVIYEHGDVIVVASSSFLSIPETIEKNNSKSAEMNLNYGKMRGVVDSQGPLKGLKIKTPAAVTGIRGTDLFVSFDPSAAQTEVQVIRGQAQLTSLPPEPFKSESSLPGEVSEKVAQNTVVEESPKTIDIKAGQIGQLEEAKIETPEGVQEKTEIKSEVKEATKQDLKEVQEASKIESKPEDIKKASEKIQNEIAQAEQKAVENVIRDVGRYDEKAAEKLKVAEVKSLDIVNAEVIKTAAQSAPEAVTSAKLEDISKPKMSDDLKFKSGFNIVATSFKYSAYESPNSEKFYIGSKQNRGPLVGMWFDYKWKERFVSSIKIDTFGLNLKTEVSGSNFSSDNSIHDAVIYNLSMTQINTKYCLKYGCFGGAMIYTDIPYMVKDELSQPVRWGVSFQPSAGVGTNLILKYDLEKWKLKMEMSHYWITTSVRVEGTEVEDHRVSIERRFNKNSGIGIVLSGFEFNVKQFHNYNSIQMTDSTRSLNNERIEAEGGGLFYNYTWE